MSLELLEAHETDNGMAVTFATERGVERLEGSPDEMARLARAMQQVAALGQLNEHESVWVEEVPVGRAVVKLGLNPGGQARVMILHDVPGAGSDLEA
jgi:DNA-binding IclR family transcriptional regulator